MSSSNSIRKVLLIGATGTLGFNVVNGLTDSLYKDKFNVFALVRKDTINSTDAKKQKIINDLKARGVTIVSGDITDDQKSLVDIITSNKIDTIVSVAGFGCIDSQTNLIEAAKAAGTVKLFIPSDFSPDTEAIGYNHPAVPFDGKLKIREAVKKSGLNYLFFNTGFFAEYALSPFTGLDLQNNTFTAAESFEKKITTTSLKNIGLSIAAAITANIQNQVVYLADATISLKELADSVESVTGKKLTRSTKTRKEYEEDFAKNPYDFAARFAVLVIEQKGLSWPVESAWNQKNTPHHTSIQELTKTIIKS